jgi:hypothetical protein
MAYGEVIDNGFDVTRVVLVNNAGERFEDTVQDGFVLFAFEQKQPIPLPMQAELYDRSGKLVWQQTVPHHGMPPWIKFK